MASHSKPYYKSNIYIKYKEASIYVKLRVKEDIFTFRLVVHLVDRLAERLVDHLVASHIKKIKMFLAANV